MKTFLLAYVIVACISMMGLTLFYPKDKPSQPVKPIEIVDMEAIEKVVAEKKNLMIQKDCMMEALWHEARGEPQIGQLAIAEVIFNRLDSGKFGSSVCEVVNQKYPNCQFSYNCDKVSDDVIVNESVAYLVSSVNMNVELAFKLRDQNELSITGGALYYQVGGTGFAIGNHKFRVTYD